MSMEKRVKVELPLIVEFDYFPYEPPERGPDAQYPGSPETLEIEAVCVGEIDITAELTAEQLDLIARDVLDALRLDALDAGYDFRSGRRLCP